MLQKPLEKSRGFFYARNFPRSLLPAIAGFFVLMKNFKPIEFKRPPKENTPPIEWFAFINLDLLQMIDDFRDCWGKPVYISQSPGAVGRKEGLSVHSLHNFDRWGEVKALDVMPEGMDDAVSAIEADRIARHICGFGGVGLYPHWLPRPGLHLDIRPISNGARWGAIKEDGKQIYVTFEQALLKMGDNE